MGFCTDDEHREFLRACPLFEEMLIRSGVILVKYWFSVNDEVQEARFQDRMRNPIKRWKLSTMDIESRRHWVDSYGVRFVKPFFQHLVVSPCWKEGSEGWSCWSSSRRARSQTWLRSDPRLVPFIFGRTWPASSYPAEREALNHHALVRQGRGTKAAGPNLRNGVEA